MEDGVREVGDLLRGDVPGRVRQDGIGRIGVAPADVEPDVQGTVGTLGEGRVLVAGEVGERGARDLDELEIAPAGFVVGDRHCAIGVARQLEPR